MYSIRHVLIITAAVLCLWLTGGASAQENQDNQPHIQPRVDPNAPLRKQPKSQPSQNEKPRQEAQPQSAPQNSPVDETDQREQGDSSSLDSQIDLNARPHDAKGTRGPEDAES